MRTYSQPENLCVHKTAFKSNVKHTLYFVGNNYMFQMFPLSHQSAEEEDEEGEEMVTERKEEKKFKKEERIKNNVMWAHRHPLHHISPFSCLLSVSLSPSFPSSSSSFTFSIISAAGVRTMTRQVSGSLIAHRLSLLIIFTVLGRG